MHAFLEQWGLINYQVDYEARAAPLGPPCTSHFTVLADTPSGLAPITGPRPTSGPSAGKQMIDFKSTKTTALLKSSSSTDDRETLNSGSTPSAAVQIEKLNIENFGLNTKIEKKQSTISVQNGLIMSSSIMRNHEWTDQEILLLLEGLEMFKDDWNKVCEHVGTRTQDECILKFLQLPIEDPYLDPSSTSQFSSGLGPLAYQPIPFSQSGNPVMSTVAFLASMVDPRVASAAAKAAIAEFSKMKDEVPPQTMDSHLANVCQAVKEGKKLDANYNIEQTGIAIVPEPPKTAVTNSTTEKAEAETKSSAENAETIKSAEQSSMEVDAPSTVTSTTNQPTEEAVSQPSTETNKTDDEKKPDTESTVDKTEKQTAESQVKLETETTASTSASTAAVTVTTTTTTTLSTTTTTMATVSAKETTANSSNMISELELKNAAASALAAAAVKARQLALNEEKKIKSTVTLLVETQLKKLEIKLRHFEELEAIMDRERENVSLLFSIY